ncbi:MAG: hypothetical protein LBI45_04470, partial [Bacteroidales bacterium]|nr:hypothetical protein [Bacteroidales bacterium]
KIHAKREHIFPQKRSYNHPEIEEKYSKYETQNCLLITWWRLHAGGGLTKAWAGDTLPNSHKCSGGHTPPLA